MNTEETEDDTVTKAEYEKYEAELDAATVVQPPVPDVNEIDRLQNMGKTS